MITPRATLASWWGRKALQTGETNPFHPEDPQHREFVYGRMTARETAAAQAKLQKELNR